MGFGESQLGWRKFQRFSVKTRPGNLVNAMTAGEHHLIGVEFQRFSVKTRPGKEREVVIKKIKTFWWT